MDIAAPATLNINVIIADRTYPMKVKPNEEEVVRNAAKRVNEKVKEFQLQYGTNDKQDFLAMAALMYAVDLFDKEEKTQLGDNKISEKLLQLDQTLDQYLNKSTS